MKAMSSRGELPELHARIAAAGGPIKFECDADTEDSTAS